MNEDIKTGMGLIRAIGLILGEMRMLSEGRAGTAPDAVRGRLSEPDYTPRLNGGSLFDEYAGEDGELTRLVYRMQRDVERHKKGGRKPEMKEERDKRIVADYEGWPATQVAEHERMSEANVRRIRQSAGVGQMDGRRAA